jgi:hypothetical protein
VATTQEVRRSGPGRPSTYRGKRSKPMIHTLFLVDCVALFALLLFSAVCAYRFGKYQGRKAGLRTYSPYEKEGMTLNDGETLVGVVEVHKGQYVFISLNIKNSANYD